MNERIKELESQCKVFVDYSGHRLCVVHSEKFAELIIRECAEVALREEHDPSDCILGHFGLKR